LAALTRSLVDKLKQKPGVNLSLNHDVKDIKRNKDNSWQIKVSDRKQR
jgi:malate dehydrogenase (quinone)